MPRFEVQTYTLADGWINTWSVTNKNGSHEPETFDSFGQALDCLDDFLHQEEEAFARGDIASMYKREDFRIVEIKNKPNVKLSDREKYEELCEILVGDSDSWTHKEIKIRLGEAVDALLKLENSDLVSDFDDSQIIKIDKEVA